MIAVDASAIVAFFLREEGWEKLAEYMRETVSLDLVVKEFYNAVWKAVRLHRLGPDDAEKALALFRKYVDGNMVLRNELDYVDKGFRIALEEGITVYDALYIALALEESTPLLTLDSRQRHIAQKYGIAVLPP
ncbi:type II toxin-antitoxin system VapC family toxin [Pyrodictium abyssi]|uniref:Type II toxin-antitoxin system VapC family toxin n=1 Tax=Pyrodictium abyssi TaxID=54256 RepID=A0ABN6ZU65_9CREN|nr:type II toxin-antitoxin system VapC family toxin [Pyrodictium abyssi]